MRQVNPRQGAILIFNWTLDYLREEMWLAGFDGSKPRRIGELVTFNTYSVSPNLKTLLRATEEGLFARPVDGGPERLLARIDWKQPSTTFWHPSGERIGFVVSQRRSGKALGGKDRRNRHAAHAAGVSGGARGCQLVA